jgi:hypothetical protein
LIPGSRREAQKRELPMRKKVRRRSMVQEPLMVRGVEARQTTREWEMAMDLQMRSQQYCLTEARYLSVGAQRWMVGQQY